MARRDDPPDRDTLIQRRTQLGVGPTKVKPGVGNQQQRGGAPAAVGVAPGGQRKIGRNDPCFCGSGKKYKHCHGR